jgi:hypothetical protein
MGWVIGAGVVAIVWWAIRRDSKVAKAAGATQSQSSGRAVMWLLISAGVVGILYLSSRGGPPAQQSEASKWAAPAPSSTAGDPYDQTGCSASRRAIEARLKSPGSAKWISCRVTTSAGVQTVMLAVDSQNAMGGLVRSEWVTQVRDNKVESVTQTR